jgi:acyl transferase domain-containing protein
MYTDYAQLTIESQGTTGMSPYFGSGNAFSAAVGRVSYCLGLQGPCMAIDTACSSSLVAINSACESLHLGQCHQAIAGGVSLMLAPGSFIAACQAHMLSPDGHCKTFDKSANGYARAEGCGMIVLKRLSDAVRDGDTIYALIKSSGVNHGGQTSGLTVPNGKAQEALLRQVSSKAGLKPDDIDYVEAHGTGTSLGDPIEIRAIGAAYGDRDRSHPLLLGSAKSNIGHAESAAGVAGVIKTVLSLNHEMLPPNLNFKELNPNIELNFPVKILTEKMPWPKGGRIRRAGVSSFGFSGVNAHVIVEEAPPIETKISEMKERPLHILTLSAKTDFALDALIKAYEDFLENTNAALGDICFSTNTGRNHERYRMAIIGKDIGELKTKLNTSEFMRGEAQQTKAYEFVATGDWVRDLNELAQAYTAGAVVDWGDFDALYARQKIALPTYPFQRKRYWSGAAIINTRFKPDFVHPLLGVRTFLGSGDVVFNGIINLRALEYLKEHKINNNIVFPLSGVLEMLVSAAKTTHPANVIRLSNVVFRSQLILSESNPVLTQVIQVEDAAKKKSLNFYAVSNDFVPEKNWAHYCSADIDLSVPESSQKINPRLLDRYQDSVEVASFYEGFMNLDIHYGEAFKSVKEIKLKESEMYCRVEVNEETDAYQYYPALLEGFFQSIMGTKDRYELVKCDEFIAYKGLKDVSHGLIKVKLTDSGDKLANIILLNGVFSIVGTMKGLYFRRNT